MAKKTTRKRTQTRRRTGKKRTPAAKRGGRKRSDGKPARRKAAARRSATGARKTPTARKKTAARSAATRRRRARPAPPKASTVTKIAAAVKGRIAGAVTAVSSGFGGNTQPDAIEILEREHRRFEELLKQGEETTERARITRRELLDTLTAELNAHELMEEKVLYPALQAHPQAREIVLEGYEEHHVADLIVAELHEVATDDEAWGAKFKVLKENIEHHIEEEEGEMFRTARSIFSREELRDLAERMLAVRSKGAAYSRA